MMRRMLLIAVLIFGCGLADPMTSRVQACPMCKIANEQDSLLPRAYMYSILFMMGMMFSLGGSVGVGMYFLGRKENAALAELEQFGDASADSNSQGALSSGIQTATA